MKLTNENIKFKMNFEVPNGYFDKLADNVMANIKFDESRRKRRRLSIISAISAAASICSIVAMGWFARPQIGGQEIAEFNYAQMYSDNIEATISDYGLMEMLYSQGEDGEASSSEYAEMVYEYYASPVNIDYYIN